MSTKLKPARKTGRALRRAPVLSMVLCTAAMVIAARPNWGSALACDASSLLTGQIWRIWTCHLVHWSLDHVLWEGLTLLALGSLCEILDRRRLAVTLAVSAALIPLGMAVTNPNMLYGGLSGLDIACFTLLITTLTRHAYARNDCAMTLVGVGFLVGLIAKILFELNTGTTIFVQSADVFTAAPLAHMIGAATGFFMALPPTDCRPAVLDIQRR